MNGSKSENCIVQLFERGCIEICTPDDKTQPIQLRTLIQFDADLVLMVTPEALDRPDLIAEHQKKTAKPAGFISRIRLALDTVHYLAAIPLAYSCMHALEQNPWHTGMGLAAMLLPFSIKPMVRKWLLSKASGTSLKTERS